MYVYSGKLFKHKKETLTFAALWMEQEIIMMNDKARFIKQMLHDAIAVWNLTQLVQGSWEK